MEKKVAKQCLFVEGTSKGETNNNPKQATIRPYKAKALCIVITTHQKHNNCCDGSKINDNGLTMQDKLTTTKTTFYVI